MSEPISVERQQCRMLVEAIRKIVTNPRTPNWIKNPLEAAVKEAKSLANASKEPVIDEKEHVRDAAAVQPCISTDDARNVLKTANTEQESAPIELDVGIECIDALDPSDECLYEIMSKGLEIDRVQLFDVRVLRGDKRTPVGAVMHNVPATYLRAVRRLRET